MRKGTTTFAEFVEKANHIHGWLYDYSQTEFRTTNDRIRIICPKHGPFEQRASHHLEGQMCKHCRAEKRFDQAREEFFRKTKEIHGDKYDYSLVNYKSAKSKVTIICRDHGEFAQVPDAHITLKTGCPKCAIERNIIARAISMDEFFNRAKILHGDKYDYNEVSFNKMRDIIRISCPIHGLWTQTVELHLRGCGCPKCGDISTGDKLVHTLDQFLSRAKQMHKDKYDYSLVQYVNARTPVEIICPEHGVFSQIPDIHTNRKSGCPRCADRWRLQNEWLDSLGVPNDTKHRQVTLTLANGSRIRADGYDPKTNTVYEFWGTYYHGHPNFYDPNATTYYGSKFGDLFERTNRKIEAIKASGYNLIDIWEHEWRRRNDHRDHGTNKSA